MIKKISVLGSTGSIGTQTLEIARYNQDIGITALAAGSNVELWKSRYGNFIPKSPASGKKRRPESLNAGSGIWM